ncbi:MAG: hypothetical protein H6767_03640 [Candidatus Peribacteria bacterium]|nr:MAG: hypothetical protein H6767_03640 [Candidatus Peribacteria bacterium]
MSLIWMSSWDWEIMFTVEFEFLFRNSKWFLGDFTLYRPIQDIVRDIIDICWKFICRNNLVYFRWWRFIGIPIKSFSPE